MNIPHFSDKCAILRLTDYRRCVFMNHSYLMQHVSHHLHALIRRYSFPGTLLETACPQPDFTDLFSPSEAFSLFPMDWDYTNLPCILSVNGSCAYTLVFCSRQYFLLGPVRFAQPVHFLLERSFPETAPAWVHTVPICDFQDFLTDVLLLFNLCRETVCTSQQLLLANCVHPETEKTLRESFFRQLFENRESGKIHNPYDQEVREFTSIENGDLEQLTQSLSEDYPGEIGTLAKSPLRNAKNRAIVVITLASRSAIRGGLSPEIAFSLSDTYVQQIEECTDIPTVFHLFHLAEFEFTRMVREIRVQKEGIPVKDKNPHITKCKDYIFTHLHDKLTVQSIADYLGLNANYLSGLFRSCEKISLREFIRREKISLARNLLLYSQYSYSEIASYLGFSSQSHLGKWFKEATHMTLRQYRNTYGVRHSTPHCVSGPLR